MHSLYSFCGCPFYYVFLVFALVLSPTLTEYQISSHKFNIHKTSWETFKGRCCNNVFRKKKDEWNIFIFLMKCLLIFFDHRKWMSTCVITLLWWYLKSHTTCFQETAIQMNDILYFNFFLPQQHSSMKYDCHLFAILVSHVMLLEWSVKKQILKYYSIHNHIQFIEQLVNVNSLQLIIITNI